MIFFLEVDDVYINKGMTEQTRDNILRKPLNVYLSENTELKAFNIRYRVDKKAVGFRFKYTLCGRDNGYEKAKEKLKQIQNQYDNVIIINKVETINNTCNDLQEYIKQYREANKERIREVDKQYREANKDKIREAKNRYREANKDKIRELNKQYREANRDRINERAAEKMERLKMSVAESNGTKNACRRCLKLMDVDNFITCNGKIYNTCKVCAPKINNTIWWDE